MAVFASIKDLERRFAGLVSKLAAGERVVATVNGEPALGPAPPEGRAPEERTGGVGYGKGHARLASIGVPDACPYGADDFDEPLPEDLPIRSLSFDR